MANEFAKMHRLRAVPVAAALVAGVVAMTCLTLTGQGFRESVGDPSPQAWRWLLGGLALAVSLVSPILLAVLASRQVDIENQGNGWLFSRTAGLEPGYLCRVKFVATGAIVVAATLLQTGLVYGIGKLAGIAAPLPAGQWAAYTASIAVVNLVLLAFHLVLSARIANQLVGLGAGVLGVFVTVSTTGMPGWAAHLLPPWGYYALATPVDARTGGVAALDPPHLSVLVLGIAGGALFLLFTRLFDRQEA
ncbi:ABC transporter permease [Streptomonospora sediminis]